ncbi:hypothetical protein O3P69_001174 [Scylla paramamosain]|uniref:Uncharacterized protein n=1 Tax=Scylla paramamosain TaxID=85552 RepID=A0AAW0UR09_SCYPA
MTSRCVPLRPGDGGASPFHPHPLSSTTSILPPLLLPFTPCTSSTPLPRPLHYHSLHNLHVPSRLLSSRAQHRNTHRKTGEHKDEAAVAWGERWRRGVSGTQGATVMLIPLIFRHHQVLHSASNVSSFIHRHARVWLGCPGGDAGENRGLLE